MAFIASFDLPLSLQGHTVHLAPLALDYAALLWACATPDLFMYMRLRPVQWTYDGFLAYIQHTLVRPHSYPFVIQLAATGEPVGMTGYIEMSPEHRRLEIGGTWIARAHHGTLVNPESKYLLLSYAFNMLKVIRVQFKTDLRNVHSQRAIEKLGAVREGVFRKHIIMDDGHMRDTVYYSITDDDWPAVNARLAIRLDYPQAVEPNLPPDDAALPAAG